MRKLLVTLMLVIAAAFGSAAATTPQWEEVTAPLPAVAREMGQETETEIMVRDGYIYLWSEKPVTVKLFSILGQLISQDTVKPGLHRIRLSSRGIYILRAGTTTRRITI